MSIKEVFERTNKIIIEGSKIKLFQDKKFLGKLDERFLPGAFKRTWLARFNKPLSYKRINGVVSEARSL